MQEKPCKDLEFLEVLDEIIGYLDWVLPFSSINEDFLWPLEEVPETSVGL